MLPQLPLSLTPPRQPRFDNFVAGSSQTAVKTLHQGLVEGQWYLLTGPRGSGKSHLALAMVADRAAAGQQAQFIPCGNERAPALLANTEAGYVVVDDIDLLAGKTEGERALFNALNVWRGRRTTVLLTAAGPPGFALPDLASRVGQAARLVLAPLDDVGLDHLIARLIEDFQLVAGRGLKPYLLGHGPRDGGRLTHLFEIMSRRALAERRVVSVPLARECLQELQT